MIGGYAGFEGGKDKNLAVGCDFEDCAAAVADVEIAECVKGETSGHAHALRISSEFARSRKTIHSAVMAGGNVEVPRGIEGESRGVHDVSRQGMQGRFIVDTEQGIGHGLPAAAGKGYKDVPGVVNGGVGDRVQVL